MSDNIKAEHFTQITAGTEIFADIESEQAIRVSGFVKGTIYSTLRIIIENTGVAKGVLQAPFIEISGKVDGEIRAKNNLLVNASASIDGQIFTKQFTLKEGASVNGDINSGVDVDVNQAKAKSSTNSSAAKKNFQENATKSSERKSPINNDTNEKDKNRKIDREVTASPKNNRTYTPPPAPHFVGTVLIGIPASGIEKVITEQIQQASEQFMEALGFKLEIFDEPVFDSFYQNLTYIKKSQSRTENVDQLYENGKRAIEDAFIKKTDSNEDKKLAKAAKSLTEAVDKVDEITITLGKIAIVKVMEDNIQTIATEIIPPQLTKLLKDNPKLVVKPSNVYAQITS